MTALTDTREPDFAMPAWPSFGLQDDIRPALEEARRRRRPVAIVTLFHSEGGSPRGVGAQMAVCDEILSGHISGGCVEADVVGHCRAAIASGESKRLIYGKGGPWDMPLPCGGRIELLIEPVPAGDAALEALLGFTERREPCVWITDGCARKCLSPKLADIPGDVEAGTVGSQVYRHYVPRTRFIIVGADPTALAIAGMAASMEMDVFVVRQHGPVEPPPLPNISYSRDRPADALASIGVDQWTAIAACTHDQDLDHETLLAGLRTPAFFVGALGSDRRRAQRLEELRNAGVSEQDLLRLKTPIGLPIGSRAPWEIAVATLAQLIAVKRDSGAEAMQSPA